MTSRFWIGVASREHVHLGIAGGFSQLCHGKAYPLKRMTVGDWLIYWLCSRNLWLSMISDGQGQPLSGFQSSS